MFKNKQLLFFIASFIITIFCCVSIFIYRTKSTIKADGFNSDNNSFYSGVTIQHNLSKTQIESLYKLCKVWGLAKYYHPSIVEGNIDWDKELFNVIPTVINSKNQEETNSLLLKWLKKYPFEIITDESIIQDINTLRDNYGLYEINLSRVKNETIYGKELSSYLNKLSQNIILDRSNSYASFSVSYPLVDFSKENEYNYSFNPNDDGIKLLSLFRFWNIYEYFSPYVNLTKENWDDILKDSIPNIVKANTYKDYVLAIAEFTAKTGDSHLKVCDNQNILYGYYGKYYLPFTIKIIDEKVVVKSVSDTARKEGLLPGDVIYKIDKTTISERINMIKKYTALSEDNKYEAAFNGCCLRTNQKKSTLKIFRNNKKLKVSISSQTKWYEPTNKPISGLIHNDEIGFINPDTLEEGDIDRLMKLFQSTKGIIIDLREYPNVENILDDIGNYIYTEPVLYSYMSISYPYIPGIFYNLPSLINPNNSTKYNGKIIILMDENSISQSEFTIMGLRQSPNAIVVGSPSIGADGNVVSLKLPYDILTIISSIGVYTPEMEQTQRIGLQPDITCYPTIKGLKEERDELVEKGIELILNNN